MGIPALEGVKLKPAAWVFPPTDNAAKILENPIYPPDYQDAIIWFPTHPQIAPIYLSLSARHEPGVVTGVGEDVTGIWLAGAGTGLGAPIPTRIPPFNIKQTQYVPVFVIIIKVRPCHSTKHLYSLSCQIQHRFGDITSSIRQPLDR